MMKVTKRERVRLTKSGWFATRTPTDSAYLDYEGSEYKRSQTVLRYSSGDYGYDWPEIVPASVKRKVEALLDKWNDDAV